MGKPIDLEAIKDELDLDTSPEATVRFDATMKRMMRMPTSKEEDEALAKWCKRMGW